MKLVTLICITLLCCTMQAVAADESQPGTEVFDFHSVRGRQSTAQASGRFEGELLDMPANARTQPMSNFGPLWSGHAHMLWDGAIGESMTTTVELEEDGIYDVTVLLTVAPDYGLFELSFNDERFP